MIPYLSKTVIRQFADSKTIYDRGRRYFTSGRILSFEILDDGNRIQADVNGNYGGYRVTIRNDEGENPEADCDCPYDGYICKHIVAVLLHYLEKGKGRPPLQLKRPEKVKKKKYCTLSKEKDKSGDANGTVSWDHSLEEIVKQTSKEAVLSGFKLLSSKKVKIETANEWRLVVAVNVPRQIYPWYRKSRGSHGKTRVVMEKSPHRIVPTISCDCTSYTSMRCEHVAAALLACHMKMHGKTIPEVEEDFFSSLRKEKFRSLIRKLDTYSAVTSGSGTLYDFYFTTSPSNGYRKDGGPEAGKYYLRIVKSRLLRSGKRGVSTAVKVNHIRKYYPGMSEWRRSTFEEFIKNVKFASRMGWYSESNLDLVKKDFENDMDSGLLNELRLLFSREPEAFRGCVFPDVRGAVRMQFAVDGKKEKVRLRTVLEFDEEMFQLDDRKVNLLGHYPLWCSVYDGDAKSFKVFEIETISPDFIRSLSSLTNAEIELTELGSFLADYYPKLTELVKVALPEGFKVEMVSFEPVPRLFLRDHRDSFSIELRFLYGDEEIPYNEKRDVVYIGRGNNIFGISRDRTKEGDIRSMLLDNHTEEHHGLLVPSMDPYEWIADVPGELSAMGFEIYGRDDLKRTRVNTAEPRLKLEISSGIDWFDLNGTISFGKQRVTMGDIIGSISEHERFVKLGDGSRGVIPRKWLDKLSGTIGLLTRDEKGRNARASRSQIALVETLLGISDSSKIDRKYRGIRERFSRFKSIESVSLPKGLRGELRPYQKAGYDWLHFLRDFSFGGCLADEMGLGKTVQVLSLLLSEKERGIRTPSLVVVPRSLLFNWEMEIAKFSPSINEFVHHGTKRPRTGGRIWGYGRDLVITTYGTLRSDRELFGGKKFNYIILDESQHIKNPLSKTARAIYGMNCMHRLAMTGTPIENNSLELWSQFAFLNPGLLGNIEYFKGTFAKSIEKERDLTKAKALRSMIYPFLLMRKKEMVAKDLPEKQVSVTYCEMEPGQRKIYDRVREEIRSDLKRTIEEDGIHKARFKILQGLMKLRQICDHPRLLDESYTGSSAKLKMLMQIIPEVISEGHKVLVFSSFVKMLNVIREEFERRKIGFSYLTGRTRKRKEEVERFQNNPDVRAFLISLKAGGLGLNLTEADYVFIVDPWWNPAAEMQAIDRTHRIGQTKNVFVYKAITKDSVEEKILKLQESKAELVRNVIAVDEGIFKKLDRDDIENLFR